MSDTPEDQEIASILKDPALLRGILRQRDALKAELAAAREDAKMYLERAERYLQLRSNPCLPFGVVRYNSDPLEYYSGTALDAAIDAARKP